MSAVIELDGLGVRFGRRQILKQLRGSFSGRAIGLLGPNGAGKTTLIHTLLGFHPANQGTARIFGRDVQREHKSIIGQIGYMPENDSFIAGYSAVRLTRMMAELNGLPPRLALERSHEALFYVGLGEARYRNLETYSLGMKQLAKLAQAIVHGPRLLFLDEPTNGLDPPHRRRMIKLIREIRDARDDIHIILSSHLLKDVEECCDEALILKDGEVAQYCNLEAERRANRKFIEVETRQDNAGFAAEIEKLGCEYALLNSHKMKMVLPEGMEIRELYKIASAGEIEIRRLDYKRDSLQDIFLKAMSPGGGSQTGTGA
jgi:ABC-2 type transport system ATP-binding protein